MKILRDSIAVLIILSIIFIVVALISTTAEGKTDPQVQIDQLMDEKQELIEQLAHDRKENDIAIAAYEQALETKTQTDTQLMLTRQAIKDKEDAILQLVDPVEARKQEREEELSFQ